MDSISLYDLDSFLSNPSNFRFISITPDYTPPDVVQFGDTITVKPGRYFWGGPRANRQYTDTQRFSDYYDLQNHIQISLNQYSDNFQTSGRLSPEVFSRTWYSIYLVASGSEEPKLCFMPFIEINNVDYNITTSGYTTIIPRSDLGGTFTRRMFTSNQPSPQVASASSNWNSSTTQWAPWQAFDRTILTDWDCWHSGTTLPQWIKLDLGAGRERTIVGYRYAARNYSDMQVPKTWTFEGSNNDSTWVVLDTKTNVETVPQATYSRYHTCSGFGSYRFYKFNVTLSSNNHACFGDIELFALPLASGISIRVVNIPLDPLNSTCGKVADAYTTDRSLCIAGNQTTAGLYLTPSGYLQTAPPSNLKSLYLGCFRTNGFSNITPFVKTRWSYSWLKNFWIWGYTAANTNYPGITNIIEGVPPTAVGAWLYMFNGRNNSASKSGFLIRLGAGSNTANWDDVVTLLEFNPEGTHYQWRSFEQWTDWPMTYTCRIANQFSDHDYGTWSTSQYYNISFHGFRE